MFQILSIFCGQFPPHLAMNFPCFAKYIKHRKEAIKRSTAQLYWAVCSVFRIIQNRPVGPEYFALGDPNKHTVLCVFSIHQYIHDTHVFILSMQQCCTKNYADTSFQHVSGLMPFCRVFITTFQHFSSSKHFILFERSNDSL